VLRESRRAHKKVPRGQWVTNKKTNAELRTETILTMKDRSSEILIFMKNDLFLERGELGGGNWGLENDDGRSLI
jgi:hypothetical protein